MKKDGGVTWIKDETRSRTDDWEQLYRNRWQHDRVVRSTHGVNCTGGCSWQIYVKDGIVDLGDAGARLPALEPGLPPYEPRGCQRGISLLLVPLQPAAREVPVHARRAARSAGGGARDARGSGRGLARRWWRIPRRARAGSRRAARADSGAPTGTRRSSSIAAAIIYTIKKHGPDRIAGFSPIPAMSMVSYAAGARFLQLIGGVNLSFYDWYCDLPPASPETWGEQTDVARVGRLVQRQLLAVDGLEPEHDPHARRHFAAEARHNGTKLWVFSPDFSQVAKYADEWIADQRRPGRRLLDGGQPRPAEGVPPRQARSPSSSTTARATPTRRSWSSSSATATAGGPGSCCAPTGWRATRGVENGDWKFLVWDGGDGAPQDADGHPRASAGRAEKGKWNLRARGRRWTGPPIDPALSFLDAHDAVVRVAARRLRRPAPCGTRRPGAVVATADGRTRARDDRVRPADGAVRRGARPRRASTPRLRRPSRALHAGLAGEVHRRRAATRSSGSRASGATPRSAPAASA